MSILEQEEPPLFKTANKNFVFLKIEEDEDSKITDQAKSSMAARLAKQLVVSKLEDKIEIANAVLSFALTFLFAISAQYENPIIPYMIYIELPILLLLAVDYFLFFYIS